MNATAEQIQSAMVVALRARDMPAVATLLRMLAVRDPDAAEVILAAIHATEDKRRAMRGADPLWAEHVEEQNRDYWEGDE